MKSHTIMKHLKKIQKGKGGNKNRFIRKRSLVKFL